MEPPLVAEPRKTISTLTPILFGISPTSPCWVDGCRKSISSVYSHYFDKYLKGYAQAGVPVQAVSCQNEIETTQNGKMPACRWSPALEAAFIRDHLGPLLRAQHEQTQIWLLDHNYNFYQRVATQLEDKQLAKYVDGVAWHGYTGTPDQMSLLHQKDPERPLPLDRRRRLYRRSRLRQELGQVGRHLHRWRWRTGAAPRLPGT